MKKVIAYLDNKFEVLILPNFNNERLSPVTS